MTGLIAGVPRIMGHSGQWGIALEPETLQNLRKDPNQGASGSSIPVSVVESSPRFCGGAGPLFHHGGAYLGRYRAREYSVTNVLVVRSNGRLRAERISAAKRDVTFPM